MRAGIVIHDDHSGLSAEWELRDEEEHKVRLIPVTIPDTGDPYRDDFAALAWLLERLELALRSDDDGSNGLAHEVTVTVPEELR